jgi:predicted flap endonuclease-1-like 5' DNA nuclease/outer membrane lipoprotein SlyB
MAVTGEQTLAAFVVDNDAVAKRLLKKVQVIDKADTNVRIIDAAVVHKAKFGRVKVHQTKDTGGMRGGIRGASIGVIAGAVIAGPAGAAVAGAAGGVLGGIHNRIRDIGINDKFMREVGSSIQKGQSALFVMYEGVWTASIGAIQDAIRADNAVLIYSSLSEDKAAALLALVTPAVEELGGEEVVEDFEVVVEPEPDDLTVITGIGPKYEAALAAGGMKTYQQLADANEVKIRGALSKANLNTPSTAATWPMQAKMAAENDWHGLMKYNQKQAESKAKPKPKKGAKAAPEPKPVKPDDLTKISGIGARMEVILNDGQVKSYDQLAHSNSKDLRLIVAAGGALPPSSLKTWPTQAAYAMKGDWDGLNAYNSKH